MPACFILKSQSFSLSMAKCWRKSNEILSQILVSILSLVTAIPSILIAVNAFQKPMHALSITRSALDIEPRTLAAISRAKSFEGEVKVVSMTGLALFRSPTSSLWKLSLTHFFLGDSLFLVSLLKFG